MSKRASTSFSADEIETLDAIMTGLLRRYDLGEPRFVARHKPRIETLLGKAKAMQANIKRKSAPASPPGGNGADSGQALVPGADAIEQP